MPSTFVAFRMTSAPISFARSAAVVSVEKNGLPGAGDEDHDMPGFELLDGAAADERLGDVLHLDRGLHARRQADLLERALQRQAVDHRGQHAHVIGGGALHAAMAGARPRQILPPPMTIGDLHAQGVRLP